ncbi:MAG: DUF4190 domain-containing protein [Planctomycetes bacterium]|nr:DUF4190 domain-containing protein [Planctomycetota bacterium]
MEATVRCQCGHEVPAPDGGPAPTACPACGRELAGSPPPPKRASCPFCCEAIHPAARKCPHCQEYLDRTLAPRPAARGASPLAIAAFILGLVGPLFCCFPGPVAALLGIVALLNRKEPKGRGMAIAGLVLGLVWTLLLFFAILYMVAHPWGEMFERPPSSHPAEPLF